MFTFGLMYLIIYLSVFISLLIFSFSFLPVKFITHWSISNYLILIQKYTIFKNIFFSLIFALTGLPPVGLFFVKFNILTTLLYQLHFFYIFIIFIIFFFNMLYYIQLFNIRNYKKKIYQNFTNDIKKYWKDTFVLYTYLTYKNIFYIVYLLVLLVLTIFVFADIYLILNL